MQNWSQRNYRKGKAPTYLASDYNTGLNPGTIDDSWSITSVAVWGMTEGQKEMK